MRLGLAVILLAVAIVFTLPAGSMAAGAIAGAVTDVDGGIVGAIITLNPGQSGEVTVYSTDGGSYQLPNLNPGIYTISVWKPGYNCDTRTNIQVNDSQTTMLDFWLYRLTNLLTNGGFETSNFTGWTRYGVSLSNYGPAGWGIVSYEGRKFVAYVTAWGENLSGGIYQRKTSLIPGKEYTFSSYIFTQSWTGNPPVSYPANCRNRLGVDFTGGTSPASPNIQWTPWTDSNDAWSPVWLKKTVTGNAATIFLEFQINEGQESNKVAFDAVYVTREEPIVRITSGPSVSSVTPTSTTITWTTDIPSTSRVDWGQDTYYEDSSFSSTPVTNHSVILTGLVPGILYNYKVTSSATGYLDGFSANRTFSTIGTIGDVKSLGDGASVGLVGKIVTAGTSEMGGCFYIEEIDRSSAIRVNTTESVSTGDAVSVAGILSTTGAEMVIDATGVSVTSSGNTPARALGCANASLGDVRSLLVRCWGTVTSGEGCFFICDGSSQPVKVITANLSSVPSSGEYAVVTGIASVEGSSSVIKPRNQQDLRIIPR